jgi:hypothetical protein
VAVMSSWPVEDAPMLPRWDSNGLLSECAVDSVGDCDDESLISFCDIGDTAAREPFLNAERHEKVDVLVLLDDLQDGRMAHVVIMAMADHHSVDVRNILNLARHVCVSFRSKEADWTTPGREDGIEQNSEAAREFDVIAGMA